MVKKSEKMYILFILNIIIWIPILNILFIHIPLAKVWYIMLSSYFITPGISVVLIAITLRFVLKKTIGLITGCIIMVNNIFYLFWGVPNYSWIIW